MAPAAPEAEYASAPSADEADLQEVAEYADDIFALHKRNESAHAFRRPENSGGAPNLQLVAAVGEGDIRG